MPDFSKTIIYKIVHKDDLNDENIYVGHTTNLKKRKQQHKENCSKSNNKHYNLKQYEFIRNNGGWNNFIMSEIEKYPCNTRKEAILREKYWEKELKSNLNTNKVGRGFKEYYQDNKEVIKNRSSNYRENNVEKLKDYYHNLSQTDEWKTKRKEKKTCDICGSIVRKMNISTHKKSQKCINAKK